MVDKEKLLKRAAEVIQNCNQWTYGAEVQFATSMISELHGPNSAQMETFKSMIVGAQKRTGASPEFLMSQQAKAVVQEMVADVSAGLIGHIRIAIAGEVIADLISLAKETLADSSDSAKT